jgi:xylulokinase
VTVVAGVDCSTQSTKVLILDLDTGQVVAEGQARHELLTGPPGASECQPAVWWDALQAALAQTGRGEDVAAISVAAQQHGLVVCGAGGVPLRPAVLWNDTRSANDADQLREAFGADWWAREVGSVPLAAFTVTSWAWLRALEPGVADAAVSVSLPHDWLTEQLTGRRVTDRGDASGTGWWSPVRNDYVDEVLAHPSVALERRLLPEVLGPTEVAGKSGDSCTGLRPGTLVGPGTGDNMAAALGLGLQPGEVAMSLGTSGTVFAVSDRAPQDPSAVVAGFADATGRFLPLACTLNATVAVDRVASWLGLTRADAAASSGTVVVVPFFDGERTPNLPTATASITGLTHQSTPAQILRSAHEGVVLTLLDAVDRVAPALAGDAPIILIGGGAQSETYRRVVQVLSGHPVEIPDQVQLVALGAAAQAAALLSGEAPDEVARRWRTRRGSQLPRLDQDAATVARHHRVREQLGLRGAGSS